MSAYITKKYWVDPSLLDGQIGGLVKDKRMVKQLIKDNASSDEAWESNLMATLCDYHCYTYQILQLFMEIHKSPRQHNPDSKKEEYLITPKMREDIINQSNLLKHLDLQLYERHKISLTLH